MLEKKTIIFIGIAIIGLLAGIGFAYDSTQPTSMTNAQKREQILKMYMAYKKEFPDVQDIDVGQAMELASTGRVVFIDVRQPEEQRVSRLPGAISADNYLENPEKYHDYIKIGYCTISYRSGVLAQELHQRGIPMYNLRAGLLGWVHSGGKVYAGTKETNRIHVYNSEWNLGPERFEAIW